MEPGEPAAPPPELAAWPPCRTCLPRKGSARPGPSHRHQPSVPRGRAHTLTRSPRPSYLSWRELGSSPQGLAGCRGCRSVSSSCASSPHVSAHVPSISVAPECPNLQFDRPFPGSKPSTWVEANRHGVPGLVPPTRQGLSPSSVLWGAMRCGLVSSYPGLYPPQARSSPSCDSCDNKRHLLTRPCPPVPLSPGETHCPKNRSPHSPAHGGHTQCVGHRPSCLASHPLP